MGLKGLTCDGGIPTPQMGKRLPVTPNEARRMQRTNYVMYWLRTEGVLVEQQSKAGLTVDGH